MLRRATFILLPLLLMPASATADGEPATAMTGWHWLDLHLDANYRRIADDKMMLWRADAATGLGVRPWKWLRLYTKLHVGRTDFSFQYGLSRGFALQSDVSNAADVSIEAGARVAVIEWRILTLDAFADYEITPYHPRFDVVSVKLDTPFGPYDITDFCRQHADFRYNLSQLNAGLGLRVRLGRWVPRLAVQYQRLSATFDPRLDEEAAQTIGLFGFDADKAKKDLSGTRHIVAISPGLSVELPASFAIDAEITTTPTVSSNYLTVRLGLSWSY